MEQVISTSQKQKGAFIPIAIIGLLFFIFGFVTWLNGALIPFLQVICDLNEFQALFVTFAFYIAYTVMALPSSLVLARTGYRNGMALGLGIMSIGALMFIPAAQTAEFSVFLLALFILGTGLTLLQTASNPYIVLLGPKESAAMRISIMGILNKGAGVLAPIVFTALIFSNMGDTSQDALMSLSAAETQALSDRLIAPYIGMASVLLLLIGLVRFSPLPEVTTDEGEEDVPADKLGIFKFPQLILGSITLFFYVGVEVLAGDTISLMGAKMGMMNFSSLTSFTMSLMVVGYLVGIACIPRYMSQSTALMGSAVIGMFCVVGILLSNPESSVFSSVVWGWLGVRLLPDPIFFIAMLGLANALVWPAIWPLALDGLGKYTAQGSALMIMGIAGGALFPLLFGRISYSTGDMQSAYWVALPCYIFILFYAIKGHKLRDWNLS